MSAAERNLILERESLLRGFDFNDDQRADIYAIVDEAEQDPRVDMVNQVLYRLAGQSSAHYSFALEVLGHQRDVAELVAGFGLRFGLSPNEVRQMVKAALTHDAAKGAEDLAPTFMLDRQWSMDDRRKTETHPERTVALQEAAGFEQAVLFYTDWHHQDLRRNDERHIEGGYGGHQIAHPNVGSEETWVFRRHLFSACDDLAANMRARVYKPGMSATEAVGRLQDNLITPDVIVNEVQRSLPVHTAA